jgi:hypothetical protein
VSSTGAVRLYAPLPLPSLSFISNGVNYYCAEDYIAIAQSDNLGFTAGAAYVTQGPVIYMVAAGGTSISQMDITGAALTAPGNHAGIAFDAVGTFGHNLIYASSDGVWTISAVGVAT